MSTLWDALLPQREYRAERGNPCPLGLDPVRYCDVQLRQRDASGHFRCSRCGVSGAGPTFVAGSDNDPIYGERRETDPTAG